MFRKEIYCSIIIPDAIILDTDFKVIITGFRTINHVDFRFKHHL